MLLILRLWIHAFRCFSIAQWHILVCFRYNSRFGISIDVDVLLEMLVRDRWLWTHRHSVFSSGRLKWKRKRDHQRRAERGRKMKDKKAAYPQPNSIETNKKKTLHDKHHLNKQFPPFPSHIPIHILNLTYSHSLPTSLTTHLNPSTHPTVF